MSMIAIAPRQVAASRVAAASTGVASALSDTADVAWRNLLTQLRTPQALVFATIQPVIFVLLFRYAFGGAIHERTTCMTCTSCATSPRTWAWPAGRAASSR